MKAPHFAYYFHVSDVNNLIFPKKVEERMKIDTKFGEIEFMNSLSQADSLKLKDWWNNAKQIGDKGSPEIPWTLSKALLFFRKNSDMNVRGLASYFFTVLNRPDGKSDVHGLLKATLPNFWDFLSQLKGCGEPEGEDLARSIVEVERGAAPKRLFTGIGFTVGGPIVAYVANEMTRGVSGFPALILIFLIFVGAGATLFGLYRVISSIYSMVKAKQF